MNIEKKVTINNQLGLHARPAALFVQIANKFDCDISVRKGSEEVNGKSIMGIMMLAAGKGDSIYIKAQGGDAEQAVDELEGLILKDLEKKDSTF